MTKIMLYTFLLLCFPINITLSSDSIQKNDSLQRQTLEEELHQLQIQKNSIAIECGFLDIHTEQGNKSLTTHVKESFQNFYKPSYPQSNVVPIAIIDYWISTVSKFLTFTLLPISIPIAIVTGTKKWFDPSDADQYRLLINKIKDIEVREKVIKKQLEALSNARKL